MDDFLKAAVATLFLAIVLFPTLAMAQSLDERLQVMAGDTILKGQHPGGPGAPFALEATLSVSDDTAVRGARVPASLISAFGSPEVVERHEVIECEAEDPRNCRLADGRKMVLGVAPVAREGATARVEVHATWDYGSERMPVVEGRWLVHLSQRQGRWQITQIETLMRT